MGESRKELEAAEGESEQLKLDSRCKRGWVRQKRIHFFNAFLKQSIARVFFCCTADSLSLDPEVSKANAYGFTGCLSSVQYNHISPLKAALRHPSVAPVTVQGSLTESSCASMMEADVNTATTIYSSSGVSCWEGIGEVDGYCRVSFLFAIMQL